jgi:hypothetical protein
MALDTRICADIAEELQAILDEQIDRAWGPDLVRGRLLEKTMAVLPLTMFCDEGVSRGIAEFDRGFLHE